MIQNRQMNTTGSALSRAAISVKDAAAKLGVSKSTVYRMNRVNGPIQFIRRDRRLFIDVLSLDQYAQTREGAPTPIRAISNDSSWLPKVASVDGALSQGTEPQHKVIANQAIRTGTGQRELVIPERRGPFVVVFVAW